MSEYQDKIKDINQEMSGAVDFWARVMISADADNWGYYLNYSEKDLMNATAIFNHISMNIGIKNGTINNDNAESLGKELRDVIIKRTGLDPWELLKK